MPSRTTPEPRGSGNPHRSDVRPPQTPRGARDTGQRGRLGTTPPVPRRPTFSRLRRPVGPRLSSFPAAGCRAPERVLFAALTWQVAGHGPLRALDERGAAPSPLSAASRSGLAEFFADLGNTVVALPVLLVAVTGVAGTAAVAAAARARKASRAAPRPPAARLRCAGGCRRSPRSLALAAVPALVVPLKLWLARPGPPRMAGGAHDGFYPSGHGATAAVAYGVAALLLTAAAASARRLRTEPRRRPGARGRGRLAARGGPAQRGRRRRAGAPGLSLAAGRPRQLVSGRGAARGVVCGVRPLGRGRGPCGAPGGGRRGWPGRDLTLAVPGRTGARGGTATSVRPHSGAGGGPIHPPALRHEEATTSVPRTGARRAGHYRPPAPVHEVGRQLPLTRTAARGAGNSRSPAPR